MRNIYSINLLVEVSSILTLAATYSVVAAFLLERISTNICMNRTWFIYITPCIRNIVTTSKVIFTLFATVLHVYCHKMTILMK
jgi:hypothetical protein